MANTIIDYVKEYGESTFSEAPMNEVDSLILCQFSYLKFDGIVAGPGENKPSVTMQKLRAHESFEKLFADERFEKDNRALFQAMIESRRYKTLKMNCYINVVETQWETQFSAITFLLEDGSIYLAYRGTDETFIGWKEDFNMAFMDPIPGQDLSVKYLNMVMGKLHKEFSIGGHSKGGNLAVYAAMNCIPKVREKIRRVYNFDGPGFRPEVLKRCGYEKVEDIITNILPHSSLVGMLFSGANTYQVVESNSFGLLQHNPFTWLVKENHFVNAEDVYRSRKAANGALNQWILSLDANQVQIFVDSLYQVISASKAETLIDFAANWKKNMQAVRKAMEELDDETKSVIKEVLRALFFTIRKRTREDTKEQDVKTDNLKKV